MSFLTDFLTFDFLLMALLGTIGLSLLCGVLSPFVVAKRLSFMGEAVSHSALLGVVVTQMLGPSNFWGQFLVSVILTLLLSLFLAWLTRNQYLPTDTALGVFLVGSLSLGIILHQSFNVETSLVSLLFGDILLVDQSSLIILWVLAVFVFLMIYRSHKWEMVTFDPKWSKSLGLNSNRYHYFLIVLLVFSILSGIKLAGVLLFNAFIILPGAFGYLMGRDMKQVKLIALVFSILISILGIILANILDTPPGATIALSQTTIYVAAKLIYWKKEA